jgi:hypothetical protein
MLIMEKPKKLEFKPVHPKNVLLASVVHGISCLFLVPKVLLIGISTQNFHINPYKHFGSTPQNHEIRIRFYVVFHY